MFAEFVTTKTKITQSTGSQCGQFNVCCVVNSNPRVECAKTKSAAISLTPLAGLSSRNIIVKFVIFLMTPGGRFIIASIAACAESAPRTPIYTVTLVTYAGTCLDLRITRANPIF